MFPKTYKSRPHTTRSRKQETPYDCVTPAGVKCAFPRFPDGRLHSTPPRERKADVAFQKGETVRVGAQHPDVHVAGSMRPYALVSHAREKQSRHNTLIRSQLLPVKTPSMEWKRESRLSVINPRISQTSSRSDQRNASVPRPRQKSCSNCPLHHTPHPLPGSLAHQNSFLFLRISRMSAAFSPHRARAFSWSRSRLANAARC